MTNNVAYIRIPWWYPPHNAFWLDLIEDSSINNTSGTVTLIDYTIPIATSGVIRWFGQKVITPGKENAVTWKILVNGGPDKIYGSITGVISIFENPTDTLIKIPNGGNIKLQVSTTDTANISVIGRLKGWHYIKI